MRVKVHPYHYKGRIIQFVVRGNETYAVILLDYRQFNNGEDNRRNRFMTAALDDLETDPPDYRSSL